MFGHYYAATEVPIVIEYDPDTLETLGRFDLGKIISDVRLITAHPLYESDGTMWNIASATGLDSKGQFNGVWRYVIFKVTPPQTEAERKNPWLRTEIVSEVAPSRFFSISYLHSFFMTENYVIIPEQPLLIGRPQKIAENLSFKILQSLSSNLIFFKFKIRNVK